MELELFGEAGDGVHQVRLSQLVFLIDANNLGNRYQL